jgi:hypothetical protein
MGAYILIADQQVGVFREIRRETPCSPVDPLPVSRCTLPSLVSSMLAIAVQDASRISDEVEHPKVQVASAMQ